jgi:hypothetical protein
MSAPVQTLRIAAGSHRLFKSPPSPKTCRLTSHLVFIIAIIGGTCGILLKLWMLYNDQKIIAVHGAVRHGIFWLGTGHSPGYSRRHCQPFSAASAQYSLLLPLLRVRISIAGNLPSVNDASSPAWRRYRPIRWYGTNSSISIRGTNASHVGVIDGVRLNLAGVSGAADLSQFPVSLVQRIEYIRGRVRRFMVLMRLAAW